MRVLPTASSRPKGRWSDALFASIDIYPTLRGLAGIPVPQHVKGRDFSATLRGGNTPESEVVFLMNQGMERNEQDAWKTGAGTPTGSEVEDGNGGGYVPPDFRGLRSKTLTYAVASGGVWLLYDNVNDPYRQKNLINGPAQKQRIEHYNTQIAARLSLANDPLDFKTPVTMKSTQPA